MQHTAPSCIAGVVAGQGDDRAELPQHLLMLLLLVLVRLRLLLLVLDLSDGRRQQLSCNLEGLQQLLLLARLHHRGGCGHGGILLSTLHRQLLLLLPDLLLLLLLWHIAVLCVMPVGSGRVPDLLRVLLLSILLLVLLLLEAVATCASSLHPELLVGQLRVLLHLQLHVASLCHLHLLLRLLLGVRHCCDQLHIVPHHAVRAAKALHGCWPGGRHTHVLRPSDDGPRSLQATVLQPAAGQAGPSCCCSCLAV